MLHEELPLAVKKELDVQGLNGVPVLLSTSTDLSLSGRPRRHWIVATHANVAAVAEQAESADGKTAPRVESYVPVADVQEFRTQGAVGSGFLQAYVDDHWVDLARYSNAEADRFHRVARSLEELRTTGAIEIHEGESLQKTHCEKCDQRLPTPGEACPRCIPRKAIFGRLAQMLWPHRTTAAIMCGLMLVAVAAELAPPKLQQYLVDDILKGGQQALDPQSLLTALLAVVSALALARIVLSIVNFAKGRLATRVGVALTFDLRAKLVEKLHTLGLGYYDRHQVGSITSRVAYDSEVIQSLLQQITGGFLLQIVQVTAVGFMLFTLNPKLAVYTLIPAPLVIAGSWFFWKRVHPKHYRYWDSSSKQAGMLTGMLSGIRVVKAFAQEDREYERFNRISDYLRTSRIRVDYSTAAFSATMQLIFSLGGLIVWYVGGRDVLAGKMTLGSLMAFLAYLAMFYTPLATLSQFTTWLTNFLTGCQRVFELLDTPVESTDPAEPIDLPDVKGRIEFDKVTFGYERHQPVLRDVSFAIEPGETIGIVGKSGSGKTTLVNLLCRFYDVNEGRVMVDGVDVRQLAANQLRRQVGVVLQEPFMFRGTIWDNLIYGLPTSTAEQAIAAAKAAQSHEFILNSPLGYDTWLGERGTGLSGGERQRLSIARAILYDPPILVLDEATSSVDAESEQAIQQALKALTRGRTTIAIAHRLSTLRDAHRILVFDRGRLVEQGSHEQLIAENGRYAKLVRLQSQTSPKASIDDLLEKADETPTNEAKATAEHDAAAEAKKFLPKWLLPGDAEICAGARDTMTVFLNASSSPPSPRGGGVIANGTRLDAASPLPNPPHQGEGAGGLLVSHRGVFAVNLFPATNPEDYISLRVWTRDGEQQEVGILRNLKEWPEEAQRLVRAALDRRYFLQTIEGVDAINLELGHLHCEVRTPHGPRRFTMRWSQSQVQDFGERGKMLLDLDDNRFLVPDVQTLPPKERELFQRYVYW
jgi:ATP-binding cassette subfamily B protein